LTSPIQGAIAMPPPYFAFFAGTGASAIFVD
jgi:hypothetical protein